MSKFKGLDGTYNTWRSMRARCMNKTHQVFQRYGGRGITVCERWMVYANFLQDMGPKPDGMSLDRVDNDGDYCRENCRWASAKENSRNRRSSRLINIDGVVKPLAEWVELVAEPSLTYATIHFRIQSGWSAHEALTKPSRLKPNRLT
jgi:hypothetical protein